jgi:two-component system chemotaxis response regulator CheY
VFLHLSLILNRMSLRVLVVDDSETTRRILRLLLGFRLNWTVCGEADNGRSGVRKFHQLQPDVVVLDLAMPDMDGIEAAKLMALDNPKIPIILFTVLDIDGLERVASEAGISAIVPKTEAWNLLGSIESLVQSQHEAL